MLHHGPVGEFRVKIATWCLFILFCIFVVCHQKICFYHFHFFFFFDKVSNLRNRILTNQKPELMIRNCQWNCMLGSKYGLSRYITVYYYSDRYMYSYLFIRNPTIKSNFSVVIVKIVVSELLLGLPLLSSYATSVMKMARNKC